MTTSSGAQGQAAQLHREKGRGNRSSRHRWLWTALALFIVAPAPFRAVSAQTTPVPTAPTGQAQTEPFAQSVSVGSATYGTDPMCPLSAVLIARQTILNSATVDTLQPIFRTTYGFVPGVSYQTADVGLENVKVGQSVCVGKGAS